MLSTRRKHGARHRLDRLRRIAHFGFMQILHFDSKYTFTVVPNLIALAEADTGSKAPVVAIPAN